MRYPDGGGLTAEQRARREQVRLAAADLGAWLCFEDESGQGLRPPTGRTWGRRGHTPVVTVTRLRQMQHRPGLIDGYLAGTGLDLTPT